MALGERLIDGLVNDGLVHGILLRDRIRDEHAGLEAEVTLRLEDSSQILRRVDARVDTPEDLAAIFQAQRDLGLKTGMLVTNPIPQQYAMDKAVIDKAIDQALAESHEQGIHGKETTPFLLARVAELTGGDSLESNIQLVLNNARVAAKTAVALCK